MLLTELHRHLDVSVRTPTLLKLAQGHGLEGTSTSLEEFSKKFLLKRPLSDLNSVLSQFNLFQKVLDRPDILKQVAFEAIEDCWNEGTRQIEFRFAPSFLCEESHLSWDEALTAFEQGRDQALKKFPDMRVGFICIVARNYGIDEAEKIIAFFLKNQKRFIGLDLAGEERTYPCRLFEKAFLPALAAGAKVTIHAGEDSGPENIWEAIELLGARRIGHGISAVKDPLLLKYLAQHQICLEMCPTSNWITGATPSLAHHPIKAVLRAGAPVCINTDDPGIFGISLPYEREICHSQVGLSKDEIHQCDQFAATASFLNPEKS